MELVLLLIAIVLLGLLANTYGAYSGDEIQSQEHELAKLGISFD